MALIVEPTNRAPEKGLKSGALGLISSKVIGIASRAPAYSLAATLGFVVVAIGLQSPIVTVLAFVPMFFVPFAFQQMNKADPDCGASFTWATCFWYYRKRLTQSVHNVFVQGVMPLAGGLILLYILGWTFWYYWNPAMSYTHFELFGREIGGTFTLDVGALLFGLILMFTMNAFHPAFFRGETLTRSSPTLVTEEFVTPVEQVD